MKINYDLKVGFTAALIGFAAAIVITSMGCEYYTEKPVIAEQPRQETPTDPAACQGTLVNGVCTITVEPTPSETPAPAPDPVVCGEGTTLVDGTCIPSIASDPAADEPETPAEDPDAQFVYRTDWTRRGYFIASTTDDDTLDGSPRFTVEATGDNDSSLAIDPRRAEDPIQMECPTNYVGAAVKPLISMVDHPTIEDTSIFELGGLELGCIAAQHWTAVGGNSDTWTNRIYGTESPMATVPGYAVVGFRLKTLKPIWTEGNYFTEASVLLQELALDGQLTGDVEDYNLMPWNLPVDGSDPETVTVECPTHAPLVTTLRYEKLGDVVVKIDIRCSKTVAAE